MTFPNRQTADNAKWQLDSPIGTGTLSVVLVTWQGWLFPDHNGTTDKNYLCTLVNFDTDWETVLKREIVEVTAKSGDTFTIVRSAGMCPRSDSDVVQDNTAYAFDEWDYFFMNLTSEQVQEIQDELVRLESYKLNIADYQAGNYVAGSSSTWTDAYAITLSPAIGAYASKQRFSFLADVGNTWAATLNVNWLGAKTLKKWNDQDLDTWDIEAWQWVEVEYDGTNFQVISALSSSNIYNAWFTNNLNISTSRSGNAETISLKTRAGTDPSATDPIIVAFRNATAWTWDFT